jgi:DNA repair and recombination protein RAD52
VANPFEAPQVRISEYTAEQIAILQARLDRNLGPEFLSQRPGAGGSKVHYISGEKVIGVANDVFGFNGWSSTIQNIQVDYVDENPSTQRVSMGISVIVRITLRDGTFHEDVGYSHSENIKGKGPAFEKTKKSATTDAIKRALRSFGRVLGGCLYDKDYLQQMNKIKIGPGKPCKLADLYRHPDYRDPAFSGVVDAKPAPTTMQRQQQAAAAAAQQSYARPAAAAAAPAPQQQQQQQQNGAALKQEARLSADDAFDDDFLSNLDGA